MPQTDSASRVRTQILVCLSNPDTVAAINEILTDRGFAVTTTYEFSQFVEAATLARYKAVVTVDAMIGRIREVSTLPILNIEALILEETGGPVLVASKRCPVSSSFAQRIAALLEDAEDLVCNRASKSSLEMELVAP